MKVLISRSKLEGILEAPKSKSIAQRLILASVLSNDKFTISKIPKCDDVESALNFAKIFNADINLNEDKNILEIRCRYFELRNSYVNLGASGTTYRISLGISSTLKGKLMLDCDPTMRRRPIHELVKALTKLGARIEYLENHGYPPVKVYGGLVGGTVEIDGSISSQYVSALIYAGVNSRDGIEVKIREPVVSKTYIKLTVQLLRKLGADIEYDQDRGIVYSYPSRIRGFVGEVPGDYALSAFIVVATLLSGNHVVLKGFNYELNKADIEIVDLLRSMDMNIEINNDLWIIEKSQRPKAISIKLTDNPDLVMPMAAMLAYAQGESRIEGIKHLVYKESDRLKSVVDTLRQFNVFAVHTENSIIIKGVEKTKAASIICPNDHRIAMMAGVLAICSDGTSTIDKAECVCKSWSTYWSDLKKLGAQISII